MLGVEVWLDIDATPHPGSIQTKEQIMNSTLSPRPWHR
jgi:hypothetical protein